jgi:diadenosine tetraphosphatase ApaH/serine/threonine PP2A family protein phosphatase
MHGGLSALPDVTLAEIRALDRFAVRHRSKRDRTRDDVLMESLLWSDPRPIVGTHESQRGAGVEFGADITRAFLHRNHLRMVIRSHEMMDEGYQVMHDDQLVTIFSASHYCGKNNNFGGFIVVTHDIAHATHLLCTYQTFQTAQEDVAELLAQHRQTLLTAYPELYVRVDVLKREMFLMTKATDVA